VSVGWPGELTGKKRVTCHWNVRSCIATSGKESYKWRQQYIYSVTGRGDISDNCDLRQIPPVSPPRTVNAPTHPARAKFLPRTLLAKFRKSTISFVMSVRPSVHMELGSHRTDFYEIWHFRIFKKICRENSNSVYIWQQ
jgi:hypothetical protein